MPQIRVLLVDDHAILRAGVRMVLENDESIEVVGEAENVGRAVELIAELRPDVVLLDIDLGSQSSLDHLDEIIDAAPEARILMLTGIIDEEANKRAMLGGAHGLLLKTQASSILLTAVKKVFAGESWFDRSFTSRVLRVAKQQSRDE